MKKTKLNILHVCPEDRATSMQRTYALRDLGHNISVLHTSKLDAKVSILEKIIRKVRFRLGYFPERNNENEALKEICSKQQFDIIFIEKGLSIESETLRYCRSQQNNVKIISYFLDDIGNKNNLSNQFLKAIKDYDFFFTNKIYNVEEYRDLGAENVYFNHNAYSRNFHRPILPEKHEEEYYKSDVCFIGNFETEREKSLIYLADLGFKIKVWGWNNPRSKINTHPNISNMKKHIYKDEYCKSMRSGKINLCFLRKENRDIETTRSIEIPACGGFMLAERTSAHTKLFEEDKEAVFFSSNEEMSEKVKYYLENDEEREIIRQNGYNKVVEADYSYNKQLRDIFNIALRKDADVEA